MAVCAYKYTNPPEHQCPHPVWAGNENYCLFHSHVQDKISDFKHELHLDPIHNKLRSSGFYDLRGFVFPSGFILENSRFSDLIRLDGAEFLGPISFQNCHFEQELRFSKFAKIPGFTFNECTFQGGLAIEGNSSLQTWIGHLIFSHCQLLHTFRLAHALVQESFEIRDKKPGNTQGSFSSVTFNGDVHFCNASFPNGLTWEGVRFEDKAALAVEDDAFGTKVEISGVSFPKTSDLGARAFSGECVFFNVIFPELVKRVHFNERAVVSFTNVTFLGGLFFHEATVKAPFDFQACEFDGSCNFSRTRLRDQGRIRFWNGCRFTGDLSFDECDLAAKDALNFERCTFNEIDFRKTDLESVSFAHCAWSEKGGLFRHRHLFEDKNSYDECEVVYRDLKNKFEKEGDHDNANAFSASELEMRRLAIRKRLGWRKFLSPYFWFLCFYGMLSLYGNSFVRVLHWGFWTFLVWVCLSLFAPWREVSQSGTAINYDLTFRLRDIVTLFTSGFWSDFFQVCSHAISMLSFGRIRHLMPMSRWGNLLEVFASIAGPVLLTLFIIALRRTFRSLKT